MGLRSTRTRRGHAHGGTHPARWLRSAVRRAHPSARSRSLPSAPAACPALRRPPIAYGQRWIGKQCVRQDLVKRPSLRAIRTATGVHTGGLADVVILIHCEDAYEKDSHRAGEANLIVVKHRVGPTATITVAFQGHYSRFVDMAQA
ncbi:DnaB-like helicase C-terminal domain-containing protein [Streptomyces sp. NPDC046197]|uniref:DnaB-like helicase C-terminal domain-containing protein n=1 Tax=Streptomyces sp. NPDC046197 TaxID=3154337 RepID=UPI0033D48E7E